MSIDDSVRDAGTVPGPTTNLTPTCCAAGR